MKNQLRIGRSKSWILFFGLILTSFSIHSQNAKGNRTQYNFNPDCKFIQENPKNAQAINYKDASWKTVSAPHTFNDVVA